MRIKFDRFLFIVNLLLSLSCLVQSGGGGEDIGDSDHVEEDDDIDPSSMFKIYEMDVNMKSKPSESQFLQSYVDVGYNTNPSSEVTAFIIVFGLNSLI